MARTTKDVMNEMDVIADIEEPTAEDFARMEELRAELIYSQVLDRS